MANTMKENNGILTYGYQYNEWVTIWTDENGLRNYKQFDTQEEAMKFFGNVNCPVAVMTTSFYNHCIRNGVN